MASETTKYRSQAIALHSEGLSYRQIEDALRREYGRLVVDYTTVWRWVKASKTTKTETNAA
jgi:intein-encoded DNA endonuclease-like protein